MDEFAYYTAESKAGVLAARGLDNDALLALARVDPYRAAKGETGVEELAAYVTVLAATGPSTNPSWVTGVAVDEAYRRGLIDEIEMDYLNR